MRTIMCAQHRALGSCTIRKNHKRSGDIKELADLVSHADGTKERRVWGKVNEATNEILDFRPI